MVGSAAIAGVIAHLAFWVLLLVGWSELGWRKAIVFVAFWLAGLLGLPLFPNGGLFFMPLVAILDVALVLLVFKGDVRVL